MEALVESELGLFEWRWRAFSTVKCKGQERRAVRGGWVYIGLSKESSRWAQIKIRTMSGWEFLSRKFEFIQHTPLNSTVFLYSRNIKTFCDTA
jgi:hypothetical protein